MSYQFYKELRSDNPAYRMQVPYGMWRTRVLEILQTVFSPMYKNIWEQNWNNSVFANMKKPYYYCDFEEGIYEVYIPTVLDASNTMHYWRIIVKVYDEVDEESIHLNQHDLQTPYCRPAGVIDSETICHMAQQTTSHYKETLREAWQKGGRKEWFKHLLRGFKHQKKRGYFTPVIVHKSPDIAVKRLLTLVYNFWKKRVVAILKKLKLQEWMFQEYIEKRANFSLLILLENFSHTMRNIVKSFLETLDWIKMKLKDLFAEIGRQNIQQSKIKPLIDEIRQIITVFKQQNSLKNPDIPVPPIINKLLTVLPNG